MFSQQNLYPGINAHLNSWLQAQPGRWQGFHSDHITFLVSVLNDDLPPGYVVRSEQSLQIAEVNPQQGGETWHSTRPDAAICQQTRDETAVAATDLAQAAIIAPIAETFAPETQMAAIMIYRVSEDQPLGQAITRIELLSPGNKPGRSGYPAYVNLRWLTLKAGLNLVEIDYLHHQPAIAPIVPPYPQAPNSTPYTVLTNTPHPSFDEGQARVFRWHVDEPLPRIPLPLAHGQVGALNLQTAYQRTFANNNRLYATLLDYSALPTHFDAYSPADQARIQARLAHIRQQDHDPT